MRAGGGTRPRRSPVTRKDVIHAKTGSRVSRSAVCVEGRMDCAQLWMENAAAVASAAAMIRAVMRREVKWT